MSEVRIKEIPIPLVNYVHLIKNRKSPYYEIAEYLVKDMEMRYKRANREFSEVVYTINPRVLQDEIEKKIESDKLTTVNICRTILALLYGSKLRKEDDFYVTTSSGGRRNYHIRVNSRTLNSFYGFI